MSSTSCVRRAGRATNLAVLGGAVAFAIATSGCAPVAYRPGNPPTRIVVNEREIAGRLDAAKARLDSAALRGDIDALLERFTPNAIVIVESRDTLRGRAAIARWLTDHTMGLAVAKVAMRDARLFACRDGALELRGTLLTRLGGRGDLEALNAVYFAKWRDDGVEGWRIDRLEAMRSLTRAPDFAGYCPSFLADEFDARRLFVSISAGPARQRSIGDGLAATLSSRGYRPGAAAYRTSEYTTLSPSAFDESVVSVRALVWHRLWVQALVQPNTVTWARYGSDGTSQARLTADVRWAAVMAGWQWGRLRAGGGLVTFDVATSALEERPLPFPGSPRLLNRAAQQPVGVVLEAAYLFLLPATNWLFVEVRAQHRTGSADAPASGIFAPSSFSIGDTRLQLHVGIAAF